MGERKRLFGSITLEATAWSILASLIIANIGFWNSWYIANSSNEIANRAGLTAVEANKIARKSLEASEDAISYTKKEFAVQYTPDLRAYLPWGIYVGAGKPYERIDDVIDIQIAICNKSYGLAKDIKLTVCYDYGDKSNHTLGQTIPVLKGGDTLPFLRFLPSIAANAKEAYSSGLKIFKMKLMLEWKDSSNNDYVSVEDFKLIAEKTGADVPMIFLFKSEGFYSSVTDGIEKTKDHTRLIIDF